MPTKHRGRPRTLNSRKKSQICDLVAGGATLAEAAGAVGASTRTIQRECRWDSKFDQELRLAQGTPADPLKLMQAAARTHWRAAAWLLEREDPERYGRRPASSCSPYQFDEALRTVVEAALEFAPPEIRSELFDRLELACEAAFEAVFPLVNEWGGRRKPKLPPTPLADQEKLLQIRQSRRFPAIADDGDAVARLLARLSAPEARPDKSPKPPKPARPPAPMLPEGASCLWAPSHAQLSAVAVASAQVAENGRLDDPPLVSEKSTRVDESLRDSHSTASPSTPDNPRAPRDERLPWQYAQRVARTMSTILPDLGDQQEADILSPKTRFATEPPGDNNSSPRPRPPRLDPPADTTSATGPTRPNPVPYPPAPAA